MQIAHHQPRLLLCGGFRLRLRCFRHGFGNRRYRRQRRADAVVYFWQRTPGCLHKLLHSRGHHEDVEAVSGPYPLVPLELRQKVYVLTSHKQGRDSPGGLRPHLYKLRGASPENSGKEAALRIHNLIDGGVGLFRIHYQFHIAVNVKTLHLAVLELRRHFLAAQLVVMVGLDMLRHEALVGELGPLYRRVIELQFYDVAEYLPVLAP